MSKYAIVESNKVTNIVEWDGDTETIAQLWRESQGEMITRWNALMYDGQRSDGNDFALIAVALSELLHIVEGLQRKCGQ